MGSPPGRVIYTSPDGAGQVLQHYSKEPQEHDNNLAAARILADRKGTESNSSPQEIPKV